MTERVRRLSVGPKPCAVADVDALVVGEDPVDRRHVEDGDVVLMRWRGRGQPAPRLAVSAEHVADDVAILLPAEPGQQHGCRIRSERQQHRGASASQNPGWYHNLLAHPDVVIEASSDGTVSVRAEELTGAVRDAAWARSTALSPGFQRHEQLTTRTIPVLALRRRDSGNEADFSRVRCPVRPLPGGTGRPGHDGGV